MKAVGNSRTTRIVHCLGMPPYLRRAVSGFGLALLLCAPAFSAEFTRAISITRVAMISTVRPAGPGAQSVVRIYTSPVGAWGSSSLPGRCRGPFHGRLAHVRHDHACLEGQFDGDGHGRKHGAGRYNRYRLQSHSSSKHIDNESHDGDCTCRICDCSELLSAPSGLLLTAGSRSRPSMSRRHAHWQSPSMSRWFVCGGI
jgi:hypothetical protein